MGLFDLFKSSSKNTDKTSASSGEKKGSAAAKWANAASNKRAQTYDRQEAINELCKLRSADAVAALLKRFTFVIDPSITDQEEKDAAFEGIVASGREAIEPVRAFAEKAESLSWPIRILKELLSEEELVDELLLWLGRWDAEYAKFIDPKLQLLSALADYENPRIREAVEPFLQDVNEPARFEAVLATFAQKDSASVRPVLEMLVDEESIRIRNKVSEGFATLEWEVPEELRDDVRKVLPSSFVIDGSGRFKKR